MTAPTGVDCPPPDRLRGLIDGAIAAEEQASITAHLDSCALCQQAIERLAAGGSELLVCAGIPKTAGPDNSAAYWPALRQLEREVVKVAHGSPEASPGMPTGDGGDEVPAPRLDFLDPAEQPGTIGKLGRFHVIELIGRGGMGLVFRALDVSLQRQVALKVLDPQYARNDLARNRFIREARAAGSIAHENVVAVHHVEQHHEAIPFLVMRLVNGVSLQDRLDAKRGPLEVRDALQIGRQMAAGLAAAHEQLLIHRDIKPANILLESGTGKVLLTDFGLARATEDARLTQTGHVAGTPLYMSPEQARGASLDFRSDLFSMGSVLYTMCTGRPPFRGSSPLAVLRAVAETEHRPVRELNPKVPEDLAAIVDQLLAKKPEERIQSAAKVAELLDAVLAHLPADPTESVKAMRSIRALPRAGRTWFHRHAALIAGLVVAGNFLLLISELTGLTQWTILGQRDWLGAPMPRLQIPVAAGPVWSVAFTADGNTLALGVDDGTVRIWDARKGRLMTQFKAQYGPVWSIAWNERAVLATVGDDPSLRLWDAFNSQAIHTIPLPSGARALAFSPDGRLVVVGTRLGGVQIYDAAEGNLVMTTAAHNGPVMALAWSLNGRLIASAGGDHAVKLWDVSGATVREVATLTGHTGSVYAVAFDPLRNVVASGSWDRTVRLWDIDQGREIKKLEGHRGDVWAVTYCSNGRVLASGSEDSTIKLWDSATGVELRTLAGQGAAVCGMAASPDGRTLAAAGRDGTVKLWDVGD